MQFVKQQKTVPIHSIEGLEVFKTIPLKDLIEANPQAPKEAITNHLRHKYPMGRSAIYVYNKEEYFFTESMFPNLNDRILEIPPGTLQENIPCRINSFALEALWSMQFQLYMDLKDTVNYKFGFDKLLLKVEFLKAKTILVLKDETFDFYYYNPENLEEIKQVVYKYFYPMLKEKPKIPK